MKLLLVEDDIDLGNVLLQYLRMQSFESVLARNGEDADAEGFDLCILDINLPGMNGLELARKIKKANKDMPIVFLTARNSREDVLEGLKLGADDYITKPFEPEELVLRVNNILRRTGKGAGDTEEEERVDTVGKMEFNMSLLRLSGYGEEHKLTLKEAELLSMLLHSRNKIVKREDILLQLWGENDYFLGRSLDVFISRLRKYLKPERSVSIDTVRGVGYIIKC